MSTSSRRRLVSGVVRLSVCLLAAGSLAGQQISGVAPAQSAGPTAQSYQGSITAGEATGQVIDLPLDDAIQRGVKNNLGVI